jgi:hypothetical protein
LASMAYGVSRAYGSYITSSVRGGR